MGESIGLRNLVKEGRVKLAIRDLRGLMRDLLESLKHENTGLESVSIIQILTQITNTYSLKHFASFDWSAEIDDGHMLSWILNVSAPGPAA